MRVLFFLILIFFGCSSEENNEPCQWYESKFRSEVIEIEFDKINSSGDSLYSIMLEFDAGSLNKEPQNLAKLLNAEITKDKLIKSKVKVGNIYSGIINDLESGNCESPIVSFNQSLTLCFK